MLLAQKERYACFACEQQQQCLYTEAQELTFNLQGSTCCMVESILRSAKYKTGLFTSPHLFDVRERIRINGYFIITFNFVIRVFIGQSCEVGLPLALSGSRILACF